MIMSLPTGGTTRDRKDALAVLYGYALREWCAIAASGAAVRVFAQSAACAALEQEIAQDPGFKLQLGRAAGFKVAFLSQ